MVIGDFPAPGYNGYTGLPCAHGIPFGGYCWACSSMGVYAPLPSLTPPQGWECPVCLRVMSPSMAMCMYCPATPPVVTMTTSGNINVTGAADNTAQRCCVRGGDARSGGCRLNGPRGDDVSFPGVFTGGGLTCFSRRWHHGWSHLPLVAVRCGGAFGSPAGQVVRHLASRRTLRGRTVADAGDCPEPEPEPEPDADSWDVDTVRVRVTHHATGKSAEGATREEAFGELVGELLRSGDIAISAGRKARGATTDDGQRHG